MHARSYFEEFRYIRKAVPSWSGQAKLLAATMAFHLNNGLRRHGAGREGLNLELLIGNELCALHIRPNRGDLFILYEVLVHEAYAIPSSLLDPDRVQLILDCGAHIGITALYLTKKYRNARIICVEPDPDNFKVLKHNVANQARIEPLWGAVVEKPGVVQLGRDRPAYRNRVGTTPVEGATVQVPGLTITDICNQKKISKIDLLKVDIEGAEKEVFVDPTFLPMVGLIAIELHAPYSLEEFRRAIASYGFRAEPPGPDSCRHAHLALPSALGFRKQSPPQ